MFAGREESPTITGGVLEGVLVNSQLITHTQLVYIKWMQTEGNRKCERLPPRGIHQDDLVLSCLCVRACKHQFFSFLSASRSASFPHTHVPRGKSIRSIVSLYCFPFRSLTHSLKFHQLIFKPLLPSSCHVIILSLPSLWPLCVCFCLSQLTMSHLPSHHVQSDYRVLSQLLCLRHNKASGCWLVPWTQLDTLFFCNLLLGSAAKRAMWMHKCTTIKNLMATSHLLCCLISSYVHTVAMAKSMFVLKTLH